MSSPRPSSFSNFFLPDSIRFFPFRVSFQFSPSLLIFFSVSCFINGISIGRHDFLNDLTSHRLIFVLHLSGELIEENRIAQNGSLRNKIHNTHHILQRVSSILYVCGCPSYFLVRCLFHAYFNSLGITLITRDYSRTKNLLGSLWVLIMKSAFNR